MSATTAALQPPQAGSGPPHNRPPPRPLLSLLGAASVLAGSAAITTLVTGTRWFGSAVLVVALIWLVGLGCRYLRLPTPATLTAQVAGLVITVTAMAGGGYGGLIPNADAIRNAVVLFTGALNQIRTSTAPAPATEELVFLIAVVLGLAALIVDFFVSAVRSPALTALPLLCLYAVPASMSAELLPWWTFALPAASYAALVTFKERPGPPGRFRARLGVALAGGVAVATAVTGSLILADAITGVGTGGRLDPSSGMRSVGDIGISPFAQLHGDLQRRTARDLLAISGLTEPDYLRITALENWNPTQGFSMNNPKPGARPAGDPITLQPLTNNPNARQTVINVQVLNLADRFLPMYQGTTSITGLETDYSYNPALGAVFRDEAAKPRDYQLTVAAGQLDPDRLRTDTTTADRNLTTADGVPEAAVDLAKSITATGETTFDRALLMKTYFTDPANQFVYSLQVPTGNTGSLLTDFLQNKQGYCEQYAAAMAVLLRSLGIPTRVAIGFTQGTQTGPGTYLITSHDAHAWVEVRFDNAGWVRFDPTPLSPAVGALQGFETDALPPTPAAAAPTVGGSAPPGDEPSATPETRTAVETVTTSGSASVSAPAGRYAWALLALLPLGAATATPFLWRRRRTRRRLSVAANGGPAAAAAAWSEIEDLGIDYGFNSGEHLTVRRAANRLASAGKLPPGPRAALRRITLGTESTWYSAHGYTPEEDDDLAADVRQIAHHLKHSTPRSLRTTLLPKSVLPVLRRRHQNSPH